MFIYSTLYGSTQGLFIGGSCRIFALVCDNKVHVDLFYDSLSKHGQVCTTSLLFNKPVTNDMARSMSYCPKSTVFCCLLVAFRGLACPK